MGLGVAGTAAAIGAAGSVASAGMNLAGSGKAAGGAQQNQYLQAMQMNQNIARTDPFVTAGQIAVQQMPGAVGVPMDLSGQPTVAQMPQAPAPFVWNPTMAGLEQTPGYQFALQQGLQATQSNAAARGLGVSGAALQGAANYATGLASQTYNQQLQNALNIYGAGLNRYGQQLQGFTAGQGAYQNQFNDYWTNQQNRFNQLQNLATLGANSASNLGTQTTTSGANIGNAAQAAGQYQGAGLANAGNALAGTINSPGVQNLLTGGGANANNQSVTGGGIFNSFSGIGPYAGGYGSYYVPPNPISQANYVPGNQGGGLL